MAGPRFWALIPSSWLPDQPCCLHILLVHINTEHTSLRPRLWTHSFLWPQPSHVPHDCPGAEHQTSLQRHVAEHLSGISCCGQFPEGARSSAESNSLLPTVQSAAVQGHTWPSTNHFRSPSHSHFGGPGAAEWRWRESCPPARLLDTFLSTALFHLCLLDKPPSFQTACRAATGSVHSLPSFQCHPHFRLTASTHCWPSPYAKQGSGSLSFFSSLDIVGDTTGPLGKSVPCARGISLPATPSTCLASS